MIFNAKYGKKSIIKKFVQWITANYYQLTSEESAKKFQDITQSLCGEIGSLTNSFKPESQDHKNNPSESIDYYTLLNFAISDPHASPFSEAVKVDFLNAMMNL